MDLLKAVHVGSAIISITGFVLRGVWMLQDSPLLKARATRILPHVVDTVLLVSAIALALRSAQYPLVHAWLTAKVLALLAYIVLGGIALKYGKTRRLRVLSFGLALAVFLYIVLVAVTRSPVLGL
ncbi:MAG: SirB2 family protein [Gammaproteobacteria bacterium]